MKWVRWIGAGSALGAGQNGRTERHRLGKFAGHRNLKKLAVNAVNNDGAECPPDAIEVARHGGAYPKGEV